MIATRISYANACRYCSAAHSGRAMLLGVPEAIMEALQVGAMFSAFNRMADAFGVEFAVPAPVAEAARA